MILCLSSWRGSGGRERNTWLMLRKKKRVRCSETEWLGRTFSEKKRERGEKKMG